MTEHINPLNPSASRWLSGISGTFQAGGGDPVAAHRQGLRMMYQAVQQQAAAMSYLDMFWLFAMLSFAVIPLAFLMKRSTSAGGSLAVH
jgi:DHA2 family multidrug resistance protein